ncbi:MAG: hypothetical protein KKB70_01880 [Proteobacteria bacterium]|nr:hypothetical protein [Pseudomonadota bacterium]
MRTAQLALLMLALLLFAACAKEVGPPPAAEAPAPNGPLATVLLLADPDGHVGTVVVTGRKGDSTVLDKEAYAVQVDQDKRLTKQFQMSKADIDRQFGQTLKAFPEAPATFILYFKGKTTSLTSESTKLLAAIGKTFWERK